MGNRLAVKCPQTLTISQRRLTAGSRRLNRCRAALKEPSLLNVFFLLAVTVCYTSPGCQLTDGGVGGIQEYRQLLLVKRQRRLGNRRKI